jgi:hypothetical protein
VLAEYIPNISVIFALFGIQISALESKGVRESESRTGTWLVSPGRWPSKKKKEVAMNKSLNMILRAVATAECCMYLSEVKRSSLAAKYNGARDCARSALINFDQPQFYTELP